MIKKYLLFATLLTCLLFTLTGCYDSNGLEKLSYVVAIGIDKKSDNLITLSIQLARMSNSSDSGSSQSSDYKIYSVDCETIDTGINILNNYLNKKINLSHCSSIIISEELARENISTYITTLGNNPEIRPTCNVMVASNSFDILDNISNSGENFSSRLYEHILASSEYTGYTSNVTINNFLACVDNKETDAIAIYASLNEGNAVQSSGIAVFKNNKMVGILSPLNTIAHSMIKNDLKSCILSLKSPFNENDLIDLEVIPINKSKINIKIINHSPLITINLNFHGNIVSSGENFDYTSSNNLKILEEKSNSHIEKIIRDYLYEISKTFNTDIIGFSKMATTNYLTENEFDKVNWNKVFKDSYFRVGCNIKINSTHLFNKK